eukprot:TRINITY_DN1510_c0_g3_i1.p1 TRINITY_DN1510_c0_g3~~TRINITY_DN1510_c0_g3_i1.p1  ORF type:complete len:351 (-),score=94.58 TRINITY_DN1510_c0_g3_i1:64-1116(-)
MNDFFGRHTLVPYMIEAAETTHPTLLKGTILEHSKGRLPPYLIVFGDRRRVKEAAKRLDRETHLPTLMEENGLNIGRIDMAVGLYKGTPVVLMESQMGGPATEINVREVVSSDCMTTSFQIDEDVTFKSDAKYVIRVGSCAGLNLSTSPDAPEHESRTFLRNFDLIITTHQIGITGADVQSLSGLLSFSPESVKSSMEVMRSTLGYSETPDKAYLRIDTDAKIIRALNEAGESLSHVHHNLGNISKDSLYAESQEHEFIAFRREYDIGSSEMEFSTLLRLCRQKTVAGDPTFAGMVCAVLGLIPGGNFENDNPLKKKAEVDALLSGLEALHILSSTHRASHLKRKADESQ